ncbi:MAG: cytochrome c [Phaeodactylibacter sp.]|nr:cytochrome c [Phaeodactylibacter sp.]MCB9274993.1 cytochrome c [Lewinellaceae bacterium]
MKSRFIVVMAVLVVGFFYANTIHAQSKDWVVPDKYKKMENPVKADKESIARGKSLWSLHCKSCHGKDGLGDGPKAANLDTPAGDFTTAAFQKQTDGALFYKSWIGKGDMPNYEKKIPEKEDVWHLVNFIRSLDD